MLQKDALTIVRQYVNNLNHAGLRIYKAWLFGSFARNQANEESDIDVLLVSEDFDTDDDVILSKPWSPKYRQDFRIEPLAIGWKRFQNCQDSIILEIIKKEGIEVI